MSVQVICLIIILGALSIHGQIPINSRPKSAIGALKLREQRDSLDTRSSCACGNIPWRQKELAGDLAPRIVGGVRALRNEYPMLAVIYCKGMFVCGGSVVSRYHILTAAHCVHDSTEKDIDVYLGVYDRDNLKTAEQMPVREIIRHSGFREINGSFVVDDIALLRVDRIKFKKSIRPICIPFNTDMRWVNQAAVAGWGVTKFNGAPSRFPERAILRVMSQEECINSAWDIPNIMKVIPNTDKMVVCAYKPAVDACQGDSGGPLFAKSSNGITYQLGIISFGDECANSDGIPGMYMNLTYYKDWLWKHLHEVRCLQPFN